MTEATLMYLEQNYYGVLAKIQSALQKAGRPQGSVRLLAVSKGHSWKAIQKIHFLGQLDFGENYVQELRQKRALQESSLSQNDFHWHYTGHLQTNKLKDLIGTIRLFHSIDRLSLAEKMNALAQQRQVRCQGLVEVNLGNEMGKFGIQKENLETFLEQLNRLSFVDIQGLMIIPPFSENPEDTRPYFKELRDILNQINHRKIYRAPLCELSMGMSHDYEVAIEEGATWVRVGTNIFGPRHP